MLTAETRVHSLHRYPVKSLSGEDLSSLDCDQRGVLGDRMWSVRTADGKIGSGKTTRRFAAVEGLLRLTARTVDESIEITLPDGRRCLVDEPHAGGLVSEFIGEPLTLARETDVSHFDDGPVSLVGLPSIDRVAVELGDEVDPQQFRANIVLDGLPALAEDELIGRHIRIGSAVLEVTMRSTRCVMVDMETAAFPAQPGTLRAVGKINDTQLGVIARVVTPGQLSVGDTLRLP